MISLATRPICVAVVVGSCLASSAHADVINGASDAFGLRVNVSAVNGLANLVVGPLPYVAGNAPTPYSNSDTVLSVSATAAGVASIQTGVLTADAWSDVDGLSGFRTASATSTVNGLDLRIVPGVVIIPDLIRMRADTIHSAATVSSNGTNLILDGEFLIEDLTLEIAGVGNVFVDANAAPNTVVFDSLGITIIANEQFVTGDGIHSSGLTVNAFHITVAPLGGNLVQADVVIGHSHGELTIPAPASCAVLLIAGLRSTRRRRLH